MKIEEVVGSRIRELRERRGWSQEELGEQLSRYFGRPWSRQGAWAAEHGTRDLQVDELLALASVLDTTVAQLLTPPAGVDEVGVREGKLTREEHLSRVVPPTAAHYVGQVVESVGPAADIVSASSTGSQTLSELAQEAVPRRARSEAAAIRDAVVHLGQTADRLDELAGREERRWLAFVNQPAGEGSDD